MMLRLIGNAFFTGFPNFGALQSFYKYLGPAVDRLCYSSKRSDSDKQSDSKRCRQRALPPIEEMFVTLVHLRLGLMEQDLAYRLTYHNPRSLGLYVPGSPSLFELKEIPLWSPRGLVRANMPQQFKSSYPTTRVIPDATEIFIEQPNLPKLQQMTFSNYSE